MPHSVLSQPFQRLTIREAIYQYTEAGAHVGADPIATASEHGFDIVQMFVGDPQAWKGHAVDHPGGAAGLRAEAEAAGWRARN